MQKLSLELNKKIIRLKMCTLEGDLKEEERECRHGTAWIKARKDRNTTTCQSQF